MLFFLKNKKILTKWIISYLLVLCLTVAVNLFAYAFIERNIVDQNNKNAVEVLKYKKQTIDNIRSELSSIAYGISTNTEFQNIVKNTEKIDASNYFSFYNLIQRLRGYFGTEFEFENEFIYFNKLDFIVSRNSSDQAEDYFDVHYSEKNMTKSQWYSYLGRNNFGEFVDFSDKLSGPGHGNLLFLYSVYGYERFKPYATIGIEVSYGDFFVEGGAEPDGKMFLAVDGDENIVLSDMDTDMAFAADFMAKHKPADGITDYGSIICVSVPSEADEWSYIHLIEKSDFRKIIRRSRLIVIFFNTICAALTGWLALVLSNINYRPIKGIIKALGDENEQMEVGEYQYISRKITEILRENKYISQQKQKQNEILKDTMLMKLLRNSPMPNNRADILSELEISFPYDNFMCVLFFIERNRDMFFDDRNEDAHTEYQLARVAVSNILDELLGHEYITNYCDIDSMLGLIINFSGSRGEDVYEKTELLRDIALKEFNICFAAGFSCLHKGMDSIHLCYEEAKMCVDYRFFEGKKLIRYKEVSHSDKGYYYPRLQEESILRMIKIGDVDSCINILDSIFDKNFKSGEISVRQAKYFLLELVTSLEKNFAEEADESGIRELFKMIDSIENNAVVFSEIREKIYGVIINYCRGKSFEKNSHLSDIVERVKEYVNNFYQDADLGVSTIADKFDITSSYMSTIFKKEEKIGLQEYILSVRMEQAKSILSITDYTIDKVAAMVGYVNSRSFSRAFSRYTGISPGKYKELNGTDKI
ncbi:MAG: helix-turn-helix transcriptional regulator [Clostridia bacterium]|nr:helix-turn-helix transcriptional regulator [Clostridia bacterium]